MNKHTHLDTWAIHDFVANNIARRLLLLPNKPDNILIIGADANISFQLLKNRYTQATITELDENADKLAFSLLQRKKSQRIKDRFFKSKQQQRLQALNQAIGTAEFDLLVANLSLNKEQAPFTTIFRHWADALKTNAMIFFSCLGPDSLKEIKSLLPEQQLTLNIPAIADMHDIGDELLGQDFIDPVMDMDMLTLSYKTVEKFWADMAILDLSQYLLCHPDLKTTIDQAILAGKLNKISLEIIYGHAIKKNVLADNETLLQFYHTKPHIN